MYICIKFIGFWQPEGWISTTAKKTNSYFKRHVSERNVLNIIFTHGGYFLQRSRIACNAE